MLQKFNQGPPGFIQKLNAIVDAVEKLLRIQGDGKFITVDRGTGDPVVSLNINAILPRIPKPVIAKQDFIKVIVKSNGGADGNSSTLATWSYDLYSPTDTLFAKKLNLAGAVQPARSAARVLKCSVTKAVDGTIGIAYYDNTGAIRLWDCQEVNPQTNCS